MNLARYTFSLLLVGLFTLPLWLSGLASQQGQSADEALLEELLEVLRDSPWAQEKFILIPTGRLTRTPYYVGRKADRTEPFPEHLPAVYLVRWESAEPVTEAFARLAELGENTVAEFLARPPADPLGLYTGYYVITVKAKEPPQSSNYDLFARFKATELRERAQLKTSRRRSVHAEQVLRTGVGATAAVHFYFPRQVEAAPLLTPREEWVEFSFTGRYSATLKVKFKKQALPLADGPAEP
ncbi:MAG: hypothetical protein ACE5MH_06625 [Terriglobia bacterium]